MGFLFTGLFWGAVLILIGLSIVLKTVFHVDIPVFRIVIAGIIIYIGLVLMFGNKVVPNISCGEGTFIKDHKMIFDGGQNEYSIVFGSGSIDATKPFNGQEQRIEINTVFGESKLTISKQIPTIIKVSGAFGNTVLPNGNNFSFGDYTYKNAAYQENMPARRIELNVVFGSCVVTELNNIL